MTAFYATRTQPVTHNVTDHQLLKFDSKTNRDLYCLHESAVAIGAREAGKLMIADVWRTVRSEESNCVFHVARFLP